MSVLTFEKKITSAVPHTKLFKVFVFEYDIIIPMIVHNVVSIEFLEGTGGPGTIKKTIFAEGSETKYIKTRVEAIDTENFTHLYSIIGGEPWSEKLEKATYEIKVLPSGNGGSICKSCSKYYPKDGCVLDEEKIKAASEEAIGLFKIVEAYLLANPDSYN